MLNEHERNWAVQIALDVLHGGEMPEDLGPEMEECVRSTVEQFREMIDQVGEEAFSQMTIDVGYDYDWD